LTLSPTDDLLILETRTERKERSHEVVRLAPEYEGRLRSTGPDFKRKVRVSFTFQALCVLLGSPSAGFGTGVLREGTGYGR